MATLKEFIIQYQQPECIGEWRGRAKSYQDALKKSGIKEDKVLSAKWPWTATELKQSPSAVTAGW